MTFEYPYNLSELRNFLDKRYSDADLRSLCFDMASRYRDKMEELKFEDFISEEKRSKIEALINHCRRRGWLQELVREAVRMQPDINWAQEIELKANDHWKLQNLQEQIFQRSNKVWFKQLVELFNLKNYKLEKRTRANTAVIVLEIATRETSDADLRALAGKVVEKYDDTDFSWQDELLIEATPYKLAELIQAMTDYFKEPDLSKLLNQYGFNYYKLPGDTKRAKLIYCILELWHQGQKERLTRLVDEVCKKIGHVVPNLCPESVEQENVTSTKQPPDGEQKFESHLLTDYEESPDDLFKWLRKKDNQFIRHPFPATPFFAEVDPLFLYSNPAMSGFVPPIDYEETIKGSPTRPGSRFILGAPGTGKSLLCRYLENDFNHSLEINLGEKTCVLALKYSNYLDYDNNLNAHDHTRLIVYSVWYQIKKYEQLISDKKKVAQFTELASDENLSAYTRFTEMIHLGHSIGLAGVCVLVDFVNSRNAHNLETGFQRILSLATRYDLLTIPGLMFKFLLPIELSGMYQAYLPIDKLGSYTLQWSKDHLKKLLTDRILFCRQQQGQRTESPEMAWGSFVSLFANQGREEIFDNQFRDDVMKYLAETSQFNPRQLLLLGRQLLEKQAVHQRETV